MPPGRAQPRPDAPVRVSRPLAAVITSKENRWLKRFRAALAGEPDEPGVVGVEGPHLVEEALSSGAQLLAVLASPQGEKEVERLLPAPAVRGLPLLRTTERLFASVAGTQAPQGIAALVRVPEHGLDDLLGGVPLVVILVGVQDPGNVGTVVRSAEAFGATGLAASAGTASPLSPKAIRASAGSIFRLPVIVRAQPPVLLAQLKLAGVKLVATVAASAGLRPAAAAGAAVAPHLLDLRGAVALLVGSEPHGLPEPVLRSADAWASIPLAAPVESLNAAVAASVVLYEAARQREASA
ncbi:MAG TPA: RNA methyltransferase [Candidatus Acidoferrales bacterium]|nr:RNA methyltransferase [Candidatus Acidoferrales bacterium]